MFLIKHPVGEPLLPHSVNQPLMVECPDVQYMAVCLNLFQTKMSGFGERKIVLFVG